MSKYVKILRSRVLSAMDAGGKKDSKFNSNLERILWWFRGKYKCKDVLCVRILVWRKQMKKLNRPYTNKQYADFAVYCMQNRLIIEDKGDYLEAVNPPEKPMEQKAAEARAERDRRINAIRWRIERYQTQDAAGLETTDTAEQYKAILLYVQALRDVPEQAGFPDAIEWPEEP